MALLWGAVVVLAAGFVRGYSGFGFSAVIVAGMSLIVSPAIAVPLAIMLEVTASLFQARSIWAQIDWRGSMILLAGGLIGNPAGVWLLEVVPGPTLKLAVYLFVLAVALLLTAAKPKPRELSTGLWFLVGLIAGLVNGATALSGLFIVTVMTLCAIAPSRMRATLIAYFFFSDFYAGGLLAWRGFITMDLGYILIAAIPIMIAGIIAGSRHFLNTDDRQFRRATLALLTGLSLLGLGQLLAA